jgi:SAM-dependent methyltransferase
MYSADFAYVHDTGFGGFAKGAGPELIRILRAHGIKGGRIVEVGSGSGILARRLIDAGYDVTGIDRSPDMIDIARAKAPGATFRRGSLTRSKIPHCAAAIAIGEVVSYVSASLRPFFVRVQAALEPGGLFIFDFMESTKGRAYAGKSFSGRDGELIFRAEVSDHGRTLTRKMTLLRNVDGKYRRSRETHHVTIRSRDEMKDALEDAGFTVEMSPLVRPLPSPVRNVAVVATKK